MLRWCYSENGQPVGPVSEPDLGSLIAGGRIGPETLIWREGMEEWLPLRQVSAQGGLDVLPPSMGYDLLKEGSHSRLAIVSMICGSIALIPFLGFFGLPAIICGHVALWQISNSRNLMIGKRMALAGLFLGYLCFLLMLAFYGMWIFKMVKEL